MIETINKICAQLPEGWIIELCMTHGEVQEGRGAFVNLVDSQGRYPNLPDSSGKTIVEQLESALVVAKEKART